MAQSYTIKGWLVRIDQRPLAPVWFSFKKPVMNNAGMWYCGGEKVYQWPAWAFPQVRFDTPVPATLTIAPD